MKIQIDISKFVSGSYRAVPSSVRWRSAIRRAQAQAGVEQTHEGQLVVPAPEVDAFLEEFAPGRASDDLGKGVRVSRHVDLLPFLRRYGADVFDAYQNPAPPEEPTKD